jgi:hypothetical protein
MSKNQTNKLIVVTTLIGSNNFITFAIKGTENDHLRIHFWDTGAIRHGIGMRVYLPPDVAEPFRETTTEANGPNKTKHCD